MNWKKVFVSHSGLDNELIGVFERSLKAVGIEPFLAERAVAAGQSVPEKIAWHIRDSNAFVPFLTKNGLENQWVNQEIGYAYRWKESQSIDSPYFFPVVEEGLTGSLKGFLGIPVVEYIPLSRNAPKDAIFRLLLVLRKYVDRNWSTLNELKIRCPSCSQEFSTKIPAHDAIDKAISRNEMLETDCRVCKRRITVNPHTLMAEGSSSGYRWESRGLFD